jgi:hypothetical protein
MVYTHLNCTMHVCRFSFSLSIIMGVCQNVSSLLQSIRQQNEFIFFECDNSGKII